MSASDVAGDHIWSDLHRRKGYILMLHQAVRLLTREQRKRPRQILVGQRMDFDLKATDADHDLRLLHPDGTEREIKPDEYLVADHPGGDEADAGLGGQVEHLAHGLVLGLQLRFS